MRGFVSITVVLGALAAVPSPSRPAVGTGDRVLPSGIVIPGHKRPETKTGYRWVEGRPWKDGGWVPGYWEPSGPRPPGRIWVGGRMARGAWIPGRWIEEVPGRTWTPGHFNRFGRWVEGTFSPPVREAPAAP
ncbi:MAG TPA: hypothetical protein PK636_08760 [bacterium]|nr:hypothetical protein [bacterium]HPJ72762.1 hypothetical protein [bacterium]